MRKSGDGKWDYVYVMTHADAYVVEERALGTLPKGAEPGESSRGAEPGEGRAISQKFLKGPVKPCGPVNHPRPKQSR